MQGPHRTGLRQLQGVDVDILVIGHATRWRHRVGSNGPVGDNGIGDREGRRHRALDQLPEIALGSRFKDFRTRHRQKVVLRMQ